MRKITLIVAILAFQACSTLPESRSEEQMYQNARKALEEGAYFKAETEYDRIEEQYPFGDYSREIQLERMYAQLMQGNSEQAEFAANRFIRLNPDHEQIDFAYYIRAMAKYNRIGKGGIFTPEPEEKSIEPLNASFASFQQLTEHFPHSEYAKQAKAYMLELRGQIAKYHLNIATWYAEKEAWVAVAQRAERILIEIPGSRYSQEAAKLAAQAYTAMGNTEKAKEFSEFASRM